MKKNLYIGLSILIVLLTADGIAWRIRMSKGRANQDSQAKALFERNCVVCHGMTGDGKGEAAYLLYPKPRNFRAGKFRLVTSQNLQPTRDDLFRTISNGMPGTAMPSWGHLSERDRWALADYVLKLNKDGWYDRGIQLNYSLAEARKYAAEMTEPGEAIPIPPEPASTPEGLEQGRKYYGTACAKCHGEKGEGKRDPTWRTAEGFPTSSRNLLRGVFKGGRDGKQLYLRFSTGLPGTPMPSGELAGDQVWRVVQYIQSLSNPAEQDRNTIRPAGLVAKRMQDLPPGPEDTRWQDIPEVYVPLMPLWWRDGYINGVRVKTAHNDQRLAFRLEWNNATRDDEGVRQQSFPEGAAIQLTASVLPPLFAMGAANEVVNIWHWKALWDEDLRGFHDVAQAFPNLVSDAYFGSKKGWKSGPHEDSTFIPARQLNNPVARQRHSSVEKANAAGFGSYTAQSPEDQNVDGSSNWKEGVWRVQFVRDLGATNRNDVPLGVGEKVSVAFAIWDGSVADRNGQKTVSIWNTLRLEP